MYIIRGRAGSYPFVVSSSFLVFETEEEAQRYKDRLRALEDSQARGGGLSSHQTLELMSLEELLDEHKPPKLLSFERYTKERAELKQTQQEMIQEIESKLPEVIDDSTAKELLALIRAKIPKL